jgi:hypothetical protein
LRLTRSNRLRTSAQSGDRSSSKTVTTVDRSRGSLSIAHVNASVARINSAICAHKNKRTTDGEPIQPVDEHRGLSPNIDFPRSRSCGVGHRCGPASDSPISGGSTGQTRHSGKQRLN